MGDEMTLLETGIGTVPLFGSNSLCNIEIKMCFDASYIPGNT
jgi:hypothetical protein